MQVSITNNVKIYNLSAGKSLPEWLSDRQKRKLVKNDIEVRQRIELIEHFEMPAISDRIKTTRDGQYVLATGIYKPRIRCYDLHNLALKFERCLDSEVIQFEVLSEDYSKMIFLHCDRYVEFHSQAGRYYRLRIPVFGRDMVYQPDTTDMFFVGASSEVYRLNLEQGRFLNSYKTNSPSLNCATLMPGHSLMLVGGVDGRVEGWDHRMKERVGELDCALSCVTGAGGDQVAKVPAVTCVSHKDNLNIGVGTSTGHVLLYDIRSSKPLLVKDHMYNLPIKNVSFSSNDDQSLVLSMDSQVVKMWDNGTGAPYSSIEATAGADFNDLVVYPGSGLMFLANEQPKMQVFYVPSIGPAPKWAKYLDNITEELEESNTATVYDDYKFVTLAELQELGIDHLIGSSLLRAHLHGYFINIKLYKKVLSRVPTNTLENARKDLIKKQLESQRDKRVKLTTDVPKVNKDLFMKLKIDEVGETKKKKKNNGDLLKDDRFGALFSDERFEVDKEDDAFRLIQPVVSKLDKDKKKEFEKKYAVRDSSDDENNSGDSDLEMESDDNESSSDDDMEWTKQLKKQHKVIQQEKNIEKINKRIADKEKKLLQRTQSSRTVQHTFSEVSNDKDLSATKTKVKKSKQSLETLISDRSEDGEVVRSETGHTMTFAPEKSKHKLKKEQENKEHREERRQIRRSAKSLKKDKLPPRFWMGKRVR